MQKTVAVEVSQYYRHPKYHKYIKTSKKFLTHDEGQQARHDKRAARTTAEPQPEAPRLAAVVVSHSVPLLPAVCVCTEEECNIGDVVEIRVCRPMSKRKRFTLHRILKPKLPIEEGARRFEAHQPEWKKSPEQLAFEQQQQQQEEKAAVASS